MPIGMRRPRRFAVCAALIWRALPLAAQPVPPRLFNGLEWRLVGPFRAGRVLGVTGAPGQPNTFYAGAVGGGLWKTTDAGLVWKPVFDAMPVASIGAVAVAPSDANVIYAGTGETDLRSDISSGDGVYKSVDGGITWKNTGLRDSRHIGCVVVHPRDARIVYVAALGHAYGPNEQRGVYKSTDGGETWAKVLDQGPDIGAVDLSLVPEAPETIYAATWRARRSPWSTYAPQGGPGSGLYKSEDGGRAWTRLAGRGLPAGEWGRVGVAVAPRTNGRRVYVLIDVKDNADAAGLYRSSDAGATWSRAGADPRIEARAWYFGRLTVHPQNPEIVYVPNIALYRSADGGKTFDIVRGAPGGDDYQNLWIDPADPSRMILGSDQGASVSVDGGSTWSTWYNQPTGQFYHVAADNEFPYHLYGAQQDSGTAVVASRTDHGGIGARDWFSVGGAESGYIAPDPRDPNLVFAGNAYGTLTRFDRRTSQGQIVSPWPAQSFGTEMSARKYRFTWTSPLVFSPLHPRALYFGSQYLLKTVDGGLHWTQISPDLTGDARGPNGARGYGVIYSIALSPLREGVIWIGTDTGLVHLTRDGGRSWINVTPPGLSDWSKVTHLEASHFDAAEAYAAVDRHRLDDYRPYLYRTRDYGHTWSPVVNGLAAPAFVNAIREDPKRRGLLFAATELGVAVSFDGGDGWQSLQLNLPATSVRDLVVHGDDLAIATHGRAFWILDDIEPLRQARARAASAEAFLYAPAPAVRITNEAFQGTPLPLEEPLAKNPPAGAILDYFLPAETGAATLEILDAKGGLIRKFSSGHPDPPAREDSAAIAPIWLPPPPRLDAGAGMHRFVWDLKYGPRGPLAPPGMYRARLTARGRSYIQPLRVALDPRSTATAADLAKQFELGMKTARERNRAAAASLEIRALRERLPKLKNHPALAASPALVAALPALDREAERIAAGLSGAAGALANVAAVVESADRVPPSQAYALFDESARALKAHLAAWEKLKRGRWAELNALLGPPGETGLEPR